MVMMPISRDRSIDSSSRVSSRPASRVREVFRDFAGSAPASKCEVNDARHREAWLEIPILESRREISREAS